MAMTLEGSPSGGKARSKLLRGALFLGVLLGGGGLGYFVVSEGYLSDFIPESEQEPITIPGAAFVSLEPVVINMPAAGDGRFLRFVGHLEVVPGQEAAARAVMPRIMDATNGYLRLLRPEDLEDVAGLLRVKAQLLRRIRLAAGDDVVVNLLISELVMS